MSEGWVVTAAEAKKTATHARRAALMENVREASVRGEYKVTAYRLTVDDIEWLGKLGYRVDAVILDKDYKISWP